MPARIPADAHGVNLLDTGLLQLAQGNARLGKGQSRLVRDRGLAVRTASHRSLVLESMEELHGEAIEDIGQAGVFRDALFGWYGTLLQCVPAHTGSRHVGRALVRQDGEDAQLAFAEVDRVVP